MCIIHVGVSWNRGTPTAGWFISWKIPSRNGWWLGVPPFQEPPNYVLRNLSSSKVGEADGYVTPLVTLLWSVGSVGVASASPSERWWKSCLIISSSACEVNISTRKDGSLECQDAIFAAIACYLLWRLSAFLEWFMDNPFMDHWSWITVLFIVQQTMYVTPEGPSHLRGAGDRLPIRGQTREFSSSWGLTTWIHIPRNATSYIKLEVIARTILYSH